MRWIREGVTFLMHCRAWIVGSEKRAESQRSLVLDVHDRSTLKYEHCLNAAHLLRCIGHKYFAMLSFSQWVCLTYTALNLPNTFFTIRLRPLAYTFPCFYSLFFCFVIRGLCLGHRLRGKALTTGSILARLQIGCR